MKRNHDIIEVATTIRHQTDKAILVDEGKEKIWLPKSQVEIDEHDEKTGAATLSMPEWLAVDKGLI